MGLFDIFKQKKETEHTESKGVDVMSDTEELGFTELLAKASTEPAYKKAFFKRILQEDLIVISMTQEVSEGYHYLKEGTSVELYTFPDGTIPVFTAVKRIFDKGVVKDDVQFLQMSGADLFGMTRGSTFIVNPYSDYKKQISASEIERLLN